MGICLFSIQYSSLNISSCLAKCLEIHNVTFACLIKQFRLSCLKYLFLC